jgi:hypothetical protein
MSAFSSLNSNSTQLYILPLSNLSSASKDSFSTILNKDRSISISTPINSIYSYSGDEYRQCRRMRNIAIANQQKQNPKQYLSPQDEQCSINQLPNNTLRPSLSRFWRTVRLLPLVVRNRRQTAQYGQQINDSEPHERRTTTAGPWQTPEENESPYRRAKLEVAEPVYNELPATTPLGPQPTFISVSSSDQDDEQDATPVTGQTLCKFFSKKIFFIHSCPFC